MIIPIAWIYPPIDRLHSGVIFARLKSGTWSLQSKDRGLMGNRYAEFESLPSVL
jgi:hypothetical protein